MKNNRFYHLFTLFALMFYLAACNSSDAGKKATEEEEADSAAKTAENIVRLSSAQISAADIQLGKIEEKQLNAELPVNGVVEVPPQSMVSVTFPYGGFVRKMNVLQGTYVKKGAVLAILENPDFVDLQESYLKNKSDLAYARQEYDRQKELYSQDVAAAKLYQKATSNYQSLMASERAMEQKVLLLGLDPQKLQADDITRSVAVHSPISGYITKVNVNLGKYANSQDELFEIVNTNDVHIELTLYEKDAGLVKKGQSVRFRLPNTNYEEQEARVLLVGREIRPDRSITVHAIPLNRRLNYIPGAFVYALISVNNSSTSALPEESVVRSGDEKRYIFVQQHKDPGDSLYQFKMVPVETGIVGDGYIQVRLPDSLQVNDSSVVIKGAFSLLSVLKNTGEE